MRILTLALLMLVAATTQASSQASAAYIGSKTITGQAASWTTLTSSSFRCGHTATACPAGLVFSTVLLRNTDSADALYFQPKAGAAESTTDAIRIDAGAVLSDVDVSGLKTRSVSIYGASGGTDAQVLAWFRSN